MPIVLESNLTAAPRSFDRPRLDTYDSAEEFSFCHWIEVGELVEEDLVPEKRVGLPHRERDEQALR